MVTRMRRFASQLSGLVLAAAVVTPIVVAQDHHAITSSHDSLSSSKDTRNNLVDRFVKPTDITKVDYFLVGPQIHHHYP